MNNHQIRKLVKNWSVGLFAAVVTLALAKIVAAAVPCQTPSNQGDQQGTCPAAANGTYDACFYWTATLNIYCVGTNANMDCVSTGDPFDIIPMKNFGYCQNRVCNYNYTIHSGADPTDLTKGTLKTSDGPCE